MDTQTTLTTPLVRCSHKAQGIDVVYTTVGKAMESLAFFTLPELLNVTMFCLRGSPSNVSENYTLQPHAQAREKCGRVGGRDKGKGKKGKERKKAAQNCRRWPWALQLPTSRDGHALNGFAQCPTHIIRFSIREGSAQLLCSDRVE